MHITLRVSWHNDGWNGHICSEPEKNVFCIGHHSYPGNVIKGERDLEWESLPNVKGQSCHGMDYSRIACGNSCNAFGNQQLKAIEKPPEWFRDGSEPAYIDIPPSTACIWNYEGMYSDEVERQPGSGQKYNYDIRLSAAKEYFGKLKEGKSLIIYYANYSNPFSEGDTSNYVIVGISRLKKVGKIHYYDNVSEINRKKYAGGFVWQMPLTSSYPDEGFCLPYHKYRDNPDVLERISFIPQNPRSFKYATREIIEDDALALVERFIEIVNFLIEIKDDTQNWDERRRWLLSLFAELWKDRGAYPGLPGVLKYLEFPEAIEYYRAAATKGSGKHAFSQLRRLFQGEIKEIPAIKISTKQLKEVTRNLSLLPGEQQQLLLDTVPRFALKGDQIEHILSKDRDQNGVLSSANDIAKNPYILSEQYYGDDPDDVISFNTIDHGVLPSPDIGLEEIFSKKSEQRFRALCVDILRKESSHSFISQDTVLFRINNKLNYLPEWKSHVFTPNYFEVDAKFLSQAIVSRKSSDQKSYLYLQQVDQDEKCIGSIIRELQQRPDIALRVEINEAHFWGLLRDSTSELNYKAPKEYEDAIAGQSKVCQQVFTKPICVISGAAGTGKTTILKSFIRSIEKAHGSGTGVVLLAPTGKAAERLREKTGRDASTIHSFLSQRGWVNENRSLKRSGGKADGSIATVIIDECSMIDLALFATLLRSVNWTAVQRLILVGDPNQLPPIGQGKVFHDLVNWIKTSSSGNLGKLDINVRHLENRVKSLGNGILDLAELYIQEKHIDGSIDKVHRENMLKKIQQGGPVEQDLTVRYWNSIDDLETKLHDEIIADLEHDTGKKADPDKLSFIWSDALKQDGETYDVSYLQVLSPFRGEFYGCDYLNTYFQNLLNGYNARRRPKEGIACFDKVLQFRNRPRSEKISAYSWKDRKVVKVEIYNGEIGFALPHPLDKSGYSSLRVNFKRLKDHSINYGYIEGRAGRPIFYEPIEENLELGYVVSVHKAQGSEFNRVYLVLPKKNNRLLSMELMYTAITRAQNHLTIFAQGDVSTFVDLSQISKSCINRINSSVFEFSPLPDDLLALSTDWYEDQKVISTLSEYFVRSKSEMNIANILCLKEIPFKYELPLFAKDGSMFLPDFTVKWQGEDYYWEHVGRLDIPKYKNHWDNKKTWYEKNFPDRLITTFESNLQSKEIEEIITQRFGR